MKPRTNTSICQRDADNPAEKLAEAIRAFANTKRQAELAKNKVRYMVNEDSRHDHELLLYLWKEAHDGIFLSSDSTG
jgi:hypothetical protein